MYAAAWFVAADVNLLGIVFVTFLQHDIFWKINEDRTFFAGIGNIEGFLDDTAKVVPVAYGHGVFADTACDPHNVYLLEGVISDEICGNLAGEAYQGNTVIVGSGDSGDQIGGTGAACDQADACASGSSGIAVCGVDQTLLVAGEYHLDGILFIQLIKNVDGVTARVCEEIINAFFLQCFYK